MVSLVVVVLAEADHPACQPMSFVVGDQVGRECIVDPHLVQLGNGGLRDGGEWREDLLGVGGVKHTKERVVGILECLRGDVDVTRFPTGLVHRPKLTNRLDRITTTRCNESSRAELINHRLDSTGCLTLVGGLQTPLELLAVVLMAELQGDVVSGLAGRYVWVRIFHGVVS